MSGACSVRGGFDSHPFPPSSRLSALTIALSGMLVASPGLAAPADTTATARPSTTATSAAQRDTARAAPAPRGGLITRAPVDTTVTSRPAPTVAPRPGTTTASSPDTIATSPPDTTSRTRRAPYEEPKGFDRPRWVMFRSLVLPGWGQLHNHAWLKAAAIGGTETMLIARLIDDRRSLDRLSDQIDASRLAGNATLEASLIEEYNARSDRFVGRQWWLGALLAYSLLDAYIDAHFRHFRVDLKDDPALPEEDRGAAGLKLSWQEHF